MALPSLLAIGLLYTDDVHYVGEEDVYMDDLYGRAWFPEITPNLRDGFFDG